MKQVVSEMVVSFNVQWAIKPSTNSQGFTASSAHSKEFASPYIIEIFYRSNNGVRVLSLLVTSKYKSLTCKFWNSTKARILVESIAIIAFHVAPSQMERRLSSIHLAMPALHPLPPKRHVMSREAIRNCKTQQLSCHLPIACTKHEIPNLHPPARNDHSRKAILQTTAVQQPSSSRKGKGAARRTRAKRGSSCPRPAPPPDIRRRTPPCDMQQSRADAQTIGPANRSRPARALAPMRGC